MFKIIAQRTIKIETIKYESYYHNVIIKYDKTQYEQASLISDFQEKNIINKVSQRLSKPPNTFILINKWDNSDYEVNADKVKECCRRTYNSAEIAF